MQVQLSWQDPINNHQHQETLETPIAIGRLSGAIPLTIGGVRISPLLLSHPQVAGYHVLIDERNGEVTVTNQRLQLPITVNGLQTTSTTLSSGDRIEIPPYEITANLQVQEVQIGEGDRCQRLVGFLIPRRCQRIDRSQCPHCNGGEIDNEPYFLVQERTLYPDFGDYRSGWGSEYYEGEVLALEFTDADAVSLETEQTDFETDLGAS